MKEEKKEMEIEILKTSEKNKSYKTICNKKKKKKVTDRRVAITKSVEKITTVGSNPILDE